MTSLVIVESPAKAKTIEKYLGKGFKVLASYGHVRDLVVKDGSVRPDEDFAMSWEVSARAKKNVAAIKAALQSSDNFILATDPDREGEAIAWHIHEVLGKALKKTDVKRVVFHEITKNAILKAIENPRDLNMDLVSAYLARRALDYLVGFSISPILWRKLPSARSAGRVQSVAVRLVCDREAEIEAFKPREYWSIDAILNTPSKEKFSARLTMLEEKKLSRFDLKNESQAEAARKITEQGNFSVTEVKPRQVQRHPTPPFTTSTLQQEASRKLGFGAMRTMKTAQQLYEGISLEGGSEGLITYMRTDSVVLSTTSLDQIRQTISQKFGKAFLPEKPRFYKTKTRNAQEAHEAIRPTVMSRMPEKLARLNSDQLRLYDLIWKRTMASQMASALVDQLTADITDKAGKSVLRASGSVIKFEGFLKIYNETRDDPEHAEDKEDKENRLPELTKNMVLTISDCKKNQHFTQPPPRYSEASLVKKLEELGIGRPSTYASILNVLKERKYVQLDQRRFVLEDSGWLVTAFLTRFFSRYVEYDFTAKLEEELDDISHGKKSWKGVLHEFWQDFHKNVETVKAIQPSDIRENLDHDLEAHFFPEAEGTKARQCKLCNDGKLEIRTGRYGVFIGCSHYPDCRYTRQISHDHQGDGEDEDEDEDHKITAVGRIVGVLDENEIIVKKGPYGFYLQLGDAPAKGKKAKRASIPKQFDPNTITLTEAEKLLSLPRLVGLHPETKEDIIASIGPYGPYLKYQGRFISLDEASDALDIQINRAVEVLAKNKNGNKADIMGTHPLGGEISMNKGRYGPYLRWESVNASIPAAMRGTKITLEEAVILVDKKKAQPPSKSFRGKKTAKRKK